MQLLHNLYVARLSRPCCSLHMDLKWLEDYLTLARTRNFSQASKERNVTQPAFSRRIRALENWLGVTLFDRRSYPVTLTNEGRIFRDTAETILGTLYAERAQFLETQHGQRPELRIAAATTLNLRFIPNWLRQLEPLTGHFTTHIITQNFHDMVHDLDEGEIDLVLQYNHSDVPMLFETLRFQTLVLAQEPMVLVSATDRDGQPLHDPFNSPFNQNPIAYMGYSRDGYFAEVEKLFFKARDKDGLILQRMGESPTSEVLKRLAITYGAMTLLPLNCAQEELDKGELTVIGDESWQVQLDIRLYRSRDSRRPAVRKIWEALNETKKSGTDWSNAKS